MAASSSGSSGLPAQPLALLGEGLETPIQLIYLLSLLGFLSVGAYLVVRQVLIRRELDEAAKALGERIRTGAASCEDFYELGVILTRKKLFTQATKNLEKAKKVWDGDEAELAQVHNALGFCYFQMAKVRAWVVAGVAVMLGFICWLLLLMVAWVAGLIGVARLDCVMAAAAVVGERWSPAWRPHTPFATPTSKQPLNQTPQPLNKQTPNQQTPHRTHTQNNPNATTNSTTPRSPSTSAPSRCRPAT